MKTSSPRVSRDVQEQLSLVGQGELPEEHLFLVGQSELPGNAAHLSAAMEGLTIFAGDPRDTDDTSTVILDDEEEECPPDEVMINYVSSLAPSLPCRGDAPPQARSCVAAHIEANTLD